MQQKVVMGAAGTDGAQLRCGWLFAAFVARRKPFRVCGGEDFFDFPGSDFSSYFSLSLLTSAAAG
jgi:hypothetical protein